MNLKPRGDRVFLAALIVSLLFHLSMVTLFRIVIYFPRVDIEFVDVSIVEDKPAPEPALTEQLTLPDPGEALDRLTDASLEAESLPRFPPLELPSLRFSELDLLRVADRHRCMPGDGSQ